MANTFDGKKWFIDTVSAHNGHAVVSANQSVVISKIRWVSANAAYHQAQICDANQAPSNGFWTSISGGVANVEESNFLDLGMSRDKRTLNGLRVQTLTSGWLDIYLE